MPTKNIHQILNQFENFFSYPRQKMRISNICDNTIYLRITYKNKHLVTEENMWPKDVRFYKTTQEFAQHYAIKLRLTLDGKLVLIPSDIYINPFLTPDYSLAKEFWQAKENMTVFQSACVTELPHKLNQKIQSQINQQLIQMANAITDTVRKNANPEHVQLQNRFLRKIQSHTNTLQRVCKYLESIENDEKTNDKTDTNPDPHHLSKKESL